MARRDITIVDTAGHDTVPTYKVSWQVDDTTASGLTANPDDSINEGEFTKQNVAGGAFAIPLVDDDVTIGTDQPIIGLAADQSTETSTVNGVVNIFMPLPGVVYEGRGTTAANIDTQAEIDTISGDYITVDVVSGAHTFDENVGSGANNAFLVLGGNPERRTLYCTVRLDGTVLGRGSA